MKFDTAISLGINCQVRNAISTVLWERAGFKKEEFTLQGIGKRVDYGTHYFD